MKVLHVLYQSLPQISGSTIRSRDILMSQNEIGIEAFAMTVPFVDNRSGRDVEIINEIKYFRSSKSINTKNEISDKQKSLKQRLNKVIQIPRFIIQLYRICKNEKPDVIHAHAMFFCGISSIIVGKILKKPTFYEIRSLWMLPKNNTYNSFVHRFSTNLLLRIEILTMRLAKKVFVINKNLKQQLIDLGVKEHKLIIIKNAVNTTLIEQNLIKIRDVEKQNDQVHFGYIGSITPYEGIPFMIEAISKIDTENRNFKFIIYGSVREPDELINIQNTIKKHKLEDVVLYKGSIDPSEVYKAYNEIDVIVNPRLKNKITDTVTPLKPLEAMAYNKIFVGSDVGGIKDLLKDCRYGYLFESDKIESLQEVLMKILKLLENEKNILRAGAKEFVIKHNSWINNAYIYQKTYAKHLN